MEIRWYSPFVQNEFIRGGRDSHCRESRCLCDKGWERQIGGKKEFHFLFFRGTDGIGESAERLRKRRKNLRDRERTDRVC